VRLPKEVHERYPDPAGRFEEFYETLTNLKLASFRREEFSPIANIPLKIRVLLQVGLRRVLELADAFTREAEAHSWVPLFVLSRATVEAAALLYDVWMRTREVLRSGDHSALSTFDDHAMKLLLGAKVEEWGGQGFTAVNVLTLIDRLDKKAVDGLRAFYDALSEHAHPNYLGMYGSYHKVEDEESKFIDTPLAERPSGIVAPLNATAISLALTMLAVEGYESALKEFTVFCEEAIYKGGTWPKDTPYPRKISE
jgi:hypothetical protein